MYQNRITVFTPTYNRAYIINNLYSSLQRQNFGDFEWLVVDDGSDDSTADLFAKWEKENNKFPIRYYRQDNGGKHRAVNYGLDLAHGELFFVVDSDDYLTDDALKKINMWFREFSNCPEIVGIVANKGYSPDKTVNNLFSHPFLDKSLLEMETYQEQGKCVLSGERAICFYTDFHRQYKYPEFEGEKFMTEAVVYNRMAYDGYKMRFYNDIIWIFEYKDDGLSVQGTEIYVKNPHGYGLWFKERADFRKYSIKEKIKMHYSFYCDLAGRIAVEEIAQCIDASLWEMKILKAIYEIKHCMN